MGAWREKLSQRVALLGCDGSSMTLKVVFLRGTQNMVRDNDIK